MAGDLLTSGHFQPPPPRLLGLTYHLSLIQSIGQENACHFSQDHTKVTKFLDFINKHPNQKGVKSFFYYLKTDFPEIQLRPIKNYYLGSKFTKLNFFSNVFITKSSNFSPVHLNLYLESLDLIQSLYFFSKNVKKFTSVGSSAFQKNLQRLDQPNFFVFLKKIMTGSSHFLCPNGQGLNE